MNLLERFLCFGAHRVTYVTDVALLDILAFLDFMGKKICIKQSYSIVFVTLTKMVVTNNKEEDNNKTNTKTKISETMTKAKRFHRDRQRQRQ